MTKQMRVCTKSTHCELQHSTVSIHTKENRCMIQDHLPVSKALWICFRFPNGVCYKSLNV